MGKSQELYNKAKKIIPGGTQLLSKRPEQFLPNLWPAYFEKAEGCKVWDLDGKAYYDMSYMGIGSCILGYKDKDVDEAVKKVIDKGVMTTLNCPEEVELAELLCDIHPWADMVRYARCGGEAMSIAVRIARTYSKKDLILFCGYHGWHDWYLAANVSEEGALDGHLLPGLSPNGVPKALKGTSMPFEYNDTEKFISLIREHEGRIAAVVMEPIRNYFPKEGFLETIREITEKKNIPLIFDEITSGWRLNSGGAHLTLGVTPDIAVFAKGMSNGYSMAAIIGKNRIMNSAQDTFISSTYWTERIGPAAAIASIKKMVKNNVSKHLMKTGEKAREAWQRSAGKKGLNIEISGIKPLSHFGFINNNPLLLKTLFTQHMLELGFLASNSLYSSFAHDDESVNKYIDALDDAFEFIKSAEESKNPENI